MRMFIAINLDPAEVQTLRAVIVRLRDHSRQGRFTDANNLHLTLHFLGEQPQDSLPLLDKVMEASRCPSFGLELKGFGAFHREGGDICWLGVTLSPGLKQLHGTLARELTAAGFALEQQPYRPHITLSRQTRMQPGFDPNAFSRDIAPIYQPVTRFSLMLSERVEGRLVYAELIGKDLI